MNLTSSPELSPGPTSSSGRLPSRIFFGDEGLRVGWGLLLFLALWLAFTFLGQALSRHLGVHVPVRAPHTEMGPAPVFWAEGLQLLAVALATLVLSWIEHRPMRVYGLGLGEFRRRYGARNFFSGLFWGFTALSILVAILVLSGVLVFDGTLLSGPQALRYGAVWGIGFLLVALFEELFLRGYLQYTLARGLAAVYESALGNRSGSRALGFWTAAIVLSFVFGLGHRTNPGESPVGLFAAGAAGLVFCLSLWRTGSLWWAVGAHMAWDWAQSFLYGVPDSGMMVRFHLFASHPVGRPVFSGGLTGPEGSVSVLPVLGLLALVILLTLRARPLTQSISGAQAPMVIDRSGTVAATQGDEAI